MQTSVYSAVLEDIADYARANYDIDLSSIASDATLEQIGFDSLAVLSVATLLENKYGLSLDDERIAEMRTFADLLALIRRKSEER